METKNVNIEIKTTLVELMTMLGCKPELIAQAKDAALAATYTIHGVGVHTTDATNIKPGVNQSNAVATAPIELSVLQQVLARAALESAVKAVLAKCIVPITLTIPTPTAEYLTEVFKPVEGISTPLILQGKPPVHYSDGVKGPNGYTVYPGTPEFDAMGVTTDPAAD